MYKTLHVLHFCKRSRVLSLDNAEPCLFHLVCAREQGKNFNSVATTRVSMCAVTHPSVNTDVQFGRHTVYIFSAVSSKRTLPRAIAAALYQSVSHNKGESPVPSIYIPLSSCSSSITRPANFSCISALRNASSADFISKWYLRRSARCKEISVMSR